MLVLLRKPVNWKKMIATRKTSGGQFYPLASETLGYWTPSSLKILKTIASKTTTCNTTSLAQAFENLMQQLSVRLWTFKMSVWCIVYCNCILAMTHYGTYLQSSFKCAFVCVCAGVPVCKKKNLKKINIYIYNTYSLVPDAGHPI